MTATMNELRERIDALVKVADEKIRTYYDKCGYKMTPPKHRADYISAKWCRMVTMENGRPRSVYCFVCLQDGETRTLGPLKAGDIHKGASYKAPARHARGSVFAADFGKCLGPFGADYLR